MRLKGWILALLASLVMLALGGLAFAEESNPSKDPGQPGNSENAPGQRLKNAARNTMRGEFEVFINGQVAHVKLDRGEVLATTDHSVTLKYLDGKESEIAMVGTVHVVIDGARDKALSDLKPGTKVAVLRITNTPKGDHTIVRAGERKPGNGNQNGRKGPNAGESNPNGNSQNPAPAAGV